MSYKAVLFDMDGVIVDSELLHVAAFQITLERFGYELTRDQYRKYFAGRADQAGFLSYFRFVGRSAHIPEIMRVKAREFLSLASEKLKLYPGVIEFILDFYKRRVPLGLVTSSPRAEADITLKVFDLADVFLGGGNC
jgi:beta-phosphoglucomutase-like phosphatase (HAD superfamily)